MATWNLDTSAYNIAAYPAAGTGYKATITTSASADTYVGTYVEVVPASTITADCYLVGAHVSTGDAGENYRIKIATGGAGSEVDRIELVWIYAGVEGIEFDIPRKLIAANARVSFDCMDSEAAQNTCDVSLRFEVAS